MYSNYFALRTAAAAATEFIARPVIVVCVCVCNGWAAERGGDGGVSAPRLSPVWRHAADAKSPVTRAIPAAAEAAPLIARTRAHIAPHARAKTHCPA